jgi:fermentation-respiration switch protein FrsA (DUF1100 family)
MVKAPVRFSWSRIELMYYFRTLMIAVTLPALCAGCSSSNQPGATQSDKVEAEVNPSPSAAPDQPKGPTLDELLLFFPAKHPKGEWKPKGLRFEDAWFTAKDGTRVHGWYCPCEKPRAVLLLAHGNAGNLTYLSGLLQYFQNDLRVTTLAFDYRGYGRSDGVATVEGVLEDARAARSFLANRAGVKQAEIVLMGRSLGGAVVVQLAAENAPRGLVLESTFSSLGDVASHHYGAAAALLIPADRLNSAARIGRYKGPLLLSHGDADRTIPYSLGLKLFEAANQPKKLVTIRGGDHNDPQSAEYYAELDRIIGTLPGE